MLLLFSINYRLDNFFISKYLLLSRINITLKETFSYVYISILLALYSHQET